MCFSPNVSYGIVTLLVPRDVSMLYFGEIPEIKLWDSHVTSATWLRIRFFLRLLAMTPVTLLVPRDIPMLHFSEIPEITLSAAVSFGFASQDHQESLEASDGHARGSWTPLTRKLQGVARCHSFV